MMLLSSHYRSMTQQLLEVAIRLCKGRLLVCHEGGYSAGYVPFCGIAIIEALNGEESGVIDPFARHESAWQLLQSNQEEAINKALQAAAILSVAA
jgi:acetoin utilization deacetylase AcuC-like enzyme